MGRRGPKPKPSALDKLDGGASHRRINRNELTPPSPSSRACPSWLRDDPVARAIWYAEAPQMIRLGLLTTVDRVLFAALCERAALYRRAAQRLRRAAKGEEDALLVETKANGTQARPEIAIAKGALEGLRQLAAAFGMTPADRRGLEATLGAPHGSDSPKRAAPASRSLDDLARRRAARLAQAGA